MNIKHKKPKIIVIGAGIGGLASAAILSKAGIDVSVLESQVYPGGCASTFYHKGYRFDAGATLAAGFYPGGPMDLLAKAVGISSWPIHQESPAMVVHLPDGQQVACHNKDSRWDEYQHDFGNQAVDFFRWQEKTADDLWRFALRLPAWPIKSFDDLRSVIKSLDRKLISHSPQLLLDFFRPVGERIPKNSGNLRLFIDGQLLISAQTTSENANALYSASALDLPKRGVAHLENGIGTLSEILVEKIKENGGEVLFRQEVVKIAPKKPSGYLIETKKKESFHADIIIANLTPWNVLDLFRENPPEFSKDLKQFSDDNWGAFMLYLGVEAEKIPDGFALHHQIIRRLPLGEGNSLFMSISPAWDTKRAPQGKRAVTISTHTRMKKWWDLFNSDLSAYENEKHAFTQKILEGLGVILPDINTASSLILPGTPITFQRYTGRKLGWVGGFPQTNLFTAFHPRLDTNLYLVGDSIFPGQSTAAVALGALRISKEIIRNYTKLNNNLLNFY